MQTLAQILAGIPADPTQVSQGLAPLLQQHMMAQAQNRDMAPHQFPDEMSPGLAEGEGPPVRGFMPRQQIPQFGGFMPGIEGEGLSPDSRARTYGEGQTIPMENPARDAAFGAETLPFTDSMLGNGRDDALFRALMARRSGYGI